MHEKQTKTRLHLFPSAPSPLHLSALGDGARQPWLVVLTCGHGLELPDQKHAVTQYTAKHDVLSIQPVRLGTGDEELAAVGVGAAVGRGKEAGSGVTTLEVFVVETAACVVSGILFLFFRDSREKTKYRSFHCMHGILLRTIYADAAGAIPL